METLVNAVKSFLACTAHRHPLGKNTQESPEKEVKVNTAQVVVIDQHVTAKYPLSSHPSLSKGLFLTEILLTAWYSRRNRRFITALVVGNFSRRRKSERAVFKLVVLAELGSSRVCCWLV